MEKIITNLLCLLCCLGIYSQSKTIDLDIRRKQDKSVEIVYKKTKPGSYTVILEFLNLENATATGYRGNFFNSKFIGVVESSGGILITLKPNDEEGFVNFDSYKSTYIRGVFNPKVKEDHVYTLPFKKGSEVHVRQAGNLSNDYFDAELPKNWKSFVFRTKNIDTVVAARKGVVIEVKEQYELDTISHFTSKKNSVIIEHKDGSIAIYKGFSKNGVLVKEGDKVYPQASLGVIDSKSNRGNTNVMHFNVSYLSNIKLDENTKKKLKDKKSRSTFLNPNFLTKNGVSKLEDNTNYITNITEEVLLSEFTKREKKKYKKGMIKMN